jgi:thiamine pyrophosphokinase
VVTDGLVYPLHGETLAPGSTRGVSNVFAATEARVALTSGVLLVVRPG